MIQGQLPLIINTLFLRMTAILFRVHHATFDITWNNSNYFIINNHFKAYGDNYIDESTADEEMRRRLACQKLDKFKYFYLYRIKVIVLGDMNDQIAEPEDYNVFY